MADLSHSKQITGLHLKNRKLGFHFKSMTPKSGVLVRSPLIDRPTAANSLRPHLFGIQKWPTESQGPFKGLMATSEVTAIGPTEIYEDYNQSNMMRLRSSCHNNLGKSSFLISKNLLFCLFCRANPSTNRPSRVSPTW